MSQIDPNFYFKKLEKEKLKQSKEKKGSDKDKCRNPWNRKQKQ